MTGVQEEPGAAPLEGCVRFPPRTSVVRDEGSCAGPGRPARALTTAALRGQRRVHVTVEAEARSCRGAEIGGRRTRLSCCSGQVLGATWRLPGASG